MVCNFCLLTQFMRAHGPQPLLVISWIFRSKSIHFVFLTIFLNCLQSLIYFEDLYFSRSLLQFKSHQLLECLVILTVFEYWAYKLSIVWVMVWTELLNETISKMLDVLISWIWLISSLMNFFSSLLSLTSECFLVWICFLNIGIQIVRGVWSEMSLYSRWIEWLLSSSDPYLRNIKLITKFESQSLSEYLVRI